MASVTRENIGNLHDKIKVTLSSGDYLPSFEKSLKQYAKTVNIPGFRKGMVPSAMIRKMYGQSLYQDEVLKTAGRKLEDYLKEEQVAIFGQPMVLPTDPVKLDMNAPADVDFEFEIGLKPEFDITALNEKPALSHYRIELSEKLMNDEVEKIRRRYGKVEDQEAISGPDDIIYANYRAADASGNVAEDAVVKEDTVLFEKMPEKLRDLLNGKKAGDTVLFVPSEIAEGDELASFLKDPLKITEEQAGGHYLLTLTRVGRLIPRDLDAALFAEVFQNQDVTTEEQFREKLEAEIRKEYDRISQERLHNEIYELLVHQTPIQLPVDFLKRWLKEGQEKPRTAEEVEAEFSSFDHQLRWTLISDKIVRDNGIQVSMDEVLEDIRGRVLSYFGMEAGEDVEWMKGYMDKVRKDEKMVDETYRRILFDRIFAFLRDAFSVKEETISEEEFFKLADPHAAHHHHH